MHEWIREIPVLGQGSTRPRGRICSKTTEDLTGYGYAIDAATGSRLRRSWQLPPESPVPVRTPDPAINDRGC
jgi:hypothetical protein